MAAGYTRAHAIKRLVYFEEFGEIGMAIQRETSLKRWYRSWKEALIEQSNPDWCDLWDEINK